LRSRRLALCLISVLAAAFFPAAQSAFASVPGGGVTADFNGDGFSDLAVGVPGQDVGDGTDAGAVFVIFGGTNGLTTTGRDFLIQQAAGGGSEAGDRFGEALAAGNFNGDGFADLAVGAPGEDLESPAFIQDAGAVTIYYGSMGGLIGGEHVAGSSQFLHQNSANVAGAAEDLDNFGQALTAANFGKSTHADLAVGVPFEDLGAPSDLRTDAGVVTVLYGTATGLSGAGSQQWSQDSAGVADSVESDDRFGLSLAAANFGNSTHADLAIGVPFEQSVGTIADAGAIHVLYGSSTGITATGSQFWHQNSTNVADSVEAFDFFGTALAGGNFGNSTPADLAIGVPGEDFGTTNFDAGAVNVLYGTATGLTATGSQFWHQNSTGILDAVEPADNFGAALAAADFGMGTGIDLAVGVPKEGVSGLTEAGAVNVLYGVSTGLTATGNQFWHQNSTGIANLSEANDHFGAALGAWNFGKTAQADLAVGVPDEDIASNCFGDPIEDGGIANVLYGTSTTGLSAAGNTVFWQEILGHCSEVSDQFAKALVP
jgi:nucleoside phosphorylase